MLYNRKIAKTTLNIFKDDLYKNNKFNLIKEIKYYDYT